MHVGDVVQVNDLCANSRLHGAIGTVIDGPIHESWHSWELMVVLIAGELVKFRQDTPQLEVI